MSGVPVEEPIFISLLVPLPIDTFPLSILPRTELMSFKRPFPNVLSLIPANISGLLPPPLYIFFLLLPPPFLSFFFVFLESLIFSLSDVLSSALISGVSLLLL